MKQTVSSNVARGGTVLLIGIFVPVLPSAASAHTGFFVVAWGAMAVGAFEFFPGLLPSGSPGD
ncbi:MULTISPECIES: hypothetical protein [Bradyrhizobium]|uniref:Uncharacterized protein n=1 Tax=Bradyrhizobium vignae TaxID=1549949 RepID=A0A2U3PVD7_9BRAD|nr:hypothetical protein [Bradyrhizobium vignae]SPP93086.1 protein of unknown function [Bradyrhizobium vignae]